MIKPDDRETLEHVAGDLTLSRADYEDIIARAEAAARHWDFTAPARVLDRVVEVRDPGRPRGAARRRIVAALALRLPERIPALRLPGSILELYPDAVGKMARFLREDEPEYDLDHYAKDARLALGASVPGGAEIVDLYSRIGPRLALRQIGHRDGVTSLARYLTAGSFRPMLQIHLDARDTADFNEAGREAVYRRVADLLARDRTRAGMIATSWFYDPALPAISPRLAYLQRPLEHGAYRLFICATRLDAERAAAKSPTRRALIEEGAYKPASYSLIWPRVALLAWVRSRGRRS
ncbi:hypothetical protein [Salinarimonas sp.]|uniref:hypothetical protein n=1 Tax=Salinarimonas sp. TaxID=2766526 RepID=UPI0032D8E958